MFRLKPDEDIVMVQSGDPARYFDMLRAVARPNRAYCVRHGIRYACVHGVLRGFHPWHAAFNRLYFLTDLLDLGYRGWFVHLDADAYVEDQGYDLRAYLAAIPDRAFVFNRGGTPEPWDVNSGIFFANLAHPLAAAVIRLWRDGFEAEVDAARLRTAPEWGDAPDDQYFLYAALRTVPGATDAILHETPRFMNGMDARFARQLLRVTEPDPARRVRWIVEVAEASARRGGAPAEPLGVSLGGIARGLGLPVPGREEVAAAEAGPEALAAALRGMLAKVP